MHPGESEAEEMGAADAQNIGGRESVEILTVEGFESSSEELRGQAFGELVLVLLFRRLSEPLRTTRDRHFVSLRYAQASSKTGRWGNSID